MSILFSDKPITYIYIFMILYGLSILVKSRPFLSGDEGPSGIAFLFDDLTVPRPGWEEWKRLGRLGGGKRHKSVGKHAVSTVNMLV